VNIKVTTLCENTASHGFIGEWGLGILVEVDGTKILMDTGMSFSAVHNARLLGIDLSGIDRIVLSHGHRDHTGGLREVLQTVRHKIDVIAHPDIWTNKYTRLDGQKEQFSGVPFRREELESRGAHFILTKEPCRIADSVTTSGEVPMSTDYETIDDNLFVKEDGALRSDPLADDLALFIDTPYGLVVVLGCAHRGIVNTLRHARKLSGGKPVYATIGGTHLYRATDERIRRTIADLKEMGVQKLGVSHCTGFYASAALSREFGKAFFLNNAGIQFTLP